MTDRHLTQDSAPATPTGPATPSGAAALPEAPSACPALPEAPSATRLVRAPLARLAALGRFLGTAFWVNQRAAMEYRANFLLQVFGMVLNNTAFALFWQVLLGRTGPLGGYGFAEIMLLWALVGGAFGLVQVVLGNLRQVARLVKEGDLDTYLLQPRDVLLNLAVSRSNVSGWGDVLYGYLILALLGVDWTVWLGFTALIVSGALIMAASLSLVESLVFWIKGGEGLGTAMLELLLNFGLYPNSIFPEQLRWVFYSLVPTGFIVFIPLDLLRHFTWPAALAVGLAALAWPLLAWLVFRRGLARYASGNKVAARI